MSEQVQVKRKPKYKVRDICIETYHKLQAAKQMYVDLKQTIRLIKRAKDITMLEIVNHAHENEECDLIGKKLPDAAMHIIKDTLLEVYEMRLSLAQDEINQLQKTLNLNPHPKTSKQ